VDNGLAARFLIASPGYKAKSWREPKAYNARPYYELVAKLLSVPLPRDRDGRADPATVVLSPEATERFKTFVNEHGKQTADISKAALRYHYAKLEAVAARLALIFYLCDAACDDLEGAGVQARHILGGIALARWYGREAVRVYDGYESAAESEQRELIGQIQDHGGVISLREMRRIRRRWCDPLAAEMALQSLARGGFGELKVEPSGPQGGRPTLRFTLFTHPRTTPGECPDQPITPQDAPW
jgi:hypothetical protein